MSGSILSKEKEARYGDSDTLMEPEMTVKDTNQLWVLFVVVVDNRPSPLILLS